MGLFDKMRNRIDAAASKLDLFGAQGEFDTTREATIRILQEELLRLSAQSTTGDNLEWLLPGLSGELVSTLRAHGKKLQESGFALTADSPVPSCIEIFEQLDKLQNDADEITKAFNTALHPFVYQLLSRPQSNPFPTITSPETCTCILAEMATALEGYATQATKIQENIKGAQTKTQKLTEEYLAMGETVTEEVTRHGREIVNVATKQLDILSGKEVLAVVQARLDLQAKYNDVLATKLDEALNRIEALEARMLGLDNGNH